MKGPFIAFLEVEGAPEGSDRVGGKASTEKGGPGEESLRK